MNNLRDWGDSADGWVSDDVQAVRVIVRGLFLAAFLLASCVGAWFAWIHCSASGIPIDRVRQVLRDSLMGPRLDRGRQAELAVELLRRHVWRQSPGLDSARLLLAVAGNLRTQADADAPVALEIEFQKLLDGIRPAACQTADLQLAIDAFIQSGQLAHADWLMEAVLTRHNELTTEEYQGLLRLAADLKYDLGLEEAVLKYSSQLAALNPSDPEPWRLMAMVHEDRGHLEQYIQMLDEVVKRDPENSLTERLHITESLITLGDRERSRQQFERIAAESPEAVKQHPLLEAQLILMEGDTDMAVAIVDGILKRDASNVEATLMRAKLHLGVGEFTEAVELLERITEVSPAHREAHFLMGQALGRLGDHIQSEFHVRIHQRLLDTRVRLHRLERAAGRNPADQRVRMELVRLYRELGLDEQADFWQRTIRSTLGERD